MIIDVENLPEGGLEVCREFDFFSNELVDENTVFLDPVIVDVVVKGSGETVFIKGELKTSLSFVCSRCLSSYRFPVDICFDLVYLPMEYSDVKEQLENEDLQRFYYQERKLDLKEIMLEQLNLTFPIKPLCSDTCQGICPVCGKVIKKDKCSCAAKESDPRLEKLKDLIRDKQ